MRKLIIIIFYSLYFILFLGLIFHTSRSGDIFGKYSNSYFLLIVSAALLPIIIIAVLNKAKFLNFYTKVGIFLLLLITIFIGGEIYLREKFKYFETNQYQYSLDNFDPFLQFKLNNRYTTNINSYGFRGTEISKAKPKNTYRIFLMGGSTVLNRNTEYENTAARILEKKLKIKYPDTNIEVLNAGVDGYTSEHSIIQYLFNIKDFDPDLIIMWHGINDWYYSCNPHDRSYGEFKHDYSHFFGASGQMANKHFKPAPFISFESLLLDNIFIFLADNWFSDLRNLIYRGSARGYYFPEAENRQFKFTDYKSIISFERNMQSFVDILENDNVKLILGDQPYLYKQNMSNDEQKQIYFPVVNCTVDGKYPSIKSVIDSIDKFNTTTSDIAKKNNVDFVSLEKNIPKNLEYFTDDVHYTNKANRVIADLLFRKIDELNLLNSI